MPQWTMMTLPRITNDQRSALMRKYMGPSTLRSVAAELELDLQTALIHIYIAHKDPIHKSVIAAAERGKHECVMHGLDLLYSGGRWS